MTSITLPIVEDVQDFWESLMIWIRIDFTITGQPFFYAFYTLSKIYKSCNSALLSVSPPNPLFPFPVKTLSFLGLPTHLRTPPPRIPLRTPPRTRATDTLARAIIQAITTPLTTRLTAILQATTIRMPGIWVDMVTGSRLPSASDPASTSDYHMVGGSASAADLGSLWDRFRWIPQPQQPMFYPPPYPFRRRFKK